LIFRNIIRGSAILSLLIFSQGLVQAQGIRYWDQTLNSEAALLSNAVVAGESGVAAIYYNPATISEMKKNNLSLSANLFSVYFMHANNALGTDFPADRTQLDVYPRIITLTLNPKKKPDLTIEVAYFAKTNDYTQINQGTSLTRDIIASNPGDEYYAADYYLRSRFQDYYGGFGIGYKLSPSVAIGFSNMVSYKDDQFYNLVTADAFTLQNPEQPITGQYLSD
jgi:long-subunit fatty acid transport protein